MKESSILLEEALGSLTTGQQSTASEDKRGEDHEVHTFCPTGYPVAQRHAINSRKTDL